MPPPPPRARQWSEPAIAVALALGLNLVLILPFLLPNPAPPRPAEPPAISVDLVPEEQAPPPPPPPEPQPAPEPPVPQLFTRSGDDSGKPAALEESEETEEARQTDSTEETLEPDDQTTELEEKNTEEDIPGWARTLAPGIELRSGNPAASSRQQQAARSAGGGDVYLNKLKVLITSKVDLNEITGLRGAADFMLLVHSSGVLLDAKMVRSSGDPRLDGAFIEAIRQSRQLLPFPPGYPADIVPLQLTLTAAEPEN
ncbi:MAG: TonB C-terminal domain-containing protein [Parvibaculum sp.]